VSAGPTPPPPARPPDLDALPAIPRDREGPVFRAPWEAQAFGMAVSLHERGHFTWREWAGRLAAEIAAARERGEPDDGTRYYRYWLDALEKVVHDKRLVADDELARRAVEWETAARETPHGQPIVLRRATSGSTPPRAGPGRR
jgi:nitrile hydratase accessory protein